MYYHFRAAARRNSVTEFYSGDGLREYADVECRSLSMISRSNTKINTFQILQAISTRKIC